MDVGAHGGNVCQLISLLKALTGCKESPSLLRRKRIQTCLKNGSQITMDKLPKYKHVDPGDTDSCLLRSIVFVMNGTESFFISMSMTEDFIISKCNIYHICGP